MGDWANPYLTLAPRYEAEQLRAFAQIVRNGHLYKGYKPVHWCMDCRSALAEAEVEYEERTSPSIDVRFDVVDPADLARRVGATALPAVRASIVIWTTTPWTLPANQAVAVHPEFDYSLLAIDAGGGEELVVLASELAPSVLNRAGVETSREIARVKGAALELLAVAPSVLRPRRADDPRRARHPRERHRRRAHRSRPRPGRLHRRQAVRPAGRQSGRRRRPVPALDADLRRRKSLRREQARGRRARRTRRAAASRGVPPQLSALLAPQDAGDLPRDAPVVHQHGAGGAAQGSARGDRQGRMDAGLGRAAHLQHDRRAPGLVHLAPARLGRAACAVHAQGDRGLAPRDAGAAGARRGSRRAGRHRRVVRPRPADAARCAGRPVREGHRHHGRVGGLGPLAPLCVAHLPGDPHARGPLPRGLRPAPRLVPQFAADVRRAEGPRALQGRPHPRVHRGREGPQDVEVARQRDPAAESDEHARRRHPAPVGRSHRLRERDQRLGRDPEAHVGLVSTHPQHRALPARQPGRRSTRRGTRCRSRRCSRSIAGRSSAPGRCSRRSSRRIAATTST